MMPRSQYFSNVTDQSIIDRLLRSNDIRVLNRFGHFEALNIGNGHRYKVIVTDQWITCSCPDSRNHACKHEIATARDIGLFIGGACTHECETCKSNQTCGVHNSTPAAWADNDTGAWYERELV